MAAGQTSRAVYVPTGSQWYHFKINLPLDGPVDGGKEFDFFAPWDDPTKDNCAIYIREGAIIPFRELEQYIGELYSQGKVNPITFNIYPGRDSSYLLYLDDDGVTSNAERQEQYRLTQVTHKGMFLPYRAKISPESNNQEQMFDDFCSDFHRC